MTKKQRKLAEQRAQRLQRRQEQRQLERGAGADVPAPESAVPLHQQTLDLPVGDGTLRGSVEALRAREQLTRSMRKERRAKIKEANFLKNMT